MQCSVAEWWRMCLIWFMWHKNHHGVSNVVAKDLALIWYHGMAVHAGVALTHWGRDKMAAISQTTFSNAFSWMKVHAFCSKFRWGFATKVQINNITEVVQIMAWCRPGGKPLSKPMMVSLLTNICVTRPQWSNEDSISSCTFIIESAAHYKSVDNMALCYIIST